MESDAAGLWGITWFSRGAEGDQSQLTEIKGKI